MQLARVWSSLLRVKIDEDGIPIGECKVKDSRGKTSVEGRKGHE